MDGEEEDVRLWCEEEEDELIKCYQSAQFGTSYPRSSDDLICQLTQAGVGLVPFR